MIVTFSFIAILSAFILLRYDLLGPDQTSAILLNGQRGFPKLVLVCISATVDKTQTVQRQLILLIYQNTSKNLQSLQRLLRVGNMRWSLFGYRRSL
ncbi:hypothetical protein [Candidatus Nitrosocosmicus sp. T]